MSWVGGLRRYEVAHSLLNDASESIHDDESDCCVSVQRPVWRRVMFDQFSSLSSSPPPSFQKRPWINVSKFQLFKSWLTSPHGNSQALGAQEEMFGPSVRFLVTAPSRGRPRFLLASIGRPDTGRTSRARSSAAHSGIMPWEWRRSIPITRRWTCKHAWLVETIFGTHGKGREDVLSPCRLCLVAPQGD